MGRTEQKDCHIGMCLKHKVWYCNDKKSLEHVAIEEISFYLFSMATKRIRHLSSPKPKKVQSYAVAYHVEPVFWYRWVIDIKIELCPGYNQSFCDILQNIQGTIKSKWLGRFAQYVIFFLVTRGHILLNWEVLNHPPHSLDLSLCDYHLFGRLKKSLKV